MPSKIVWQSKITANMVKDWDDTHVSLMVEELNNFVEQCYEDFASEYTETLEEVNG